VTTLRLGAKGETCEGMQHLVALDGSMVSCGGVLRRLRAGRWSAGAPGSLASARAALVACEFAIQKEIAVVM
jgi:hypothetical protein